MFMVGNKPQTSIYEVNYYFLMFSAWVVILCVIESMFSLFPGNKVNIFVQPVAFEDQHFVMIVQFVRCGCFPNSCVLFCWPSSVNLRFVIIVPLWQLLQGRGMLPR